MPPYRDRRDKRWRFKFQHRGKGYSGSTTKSVNTKASAIALEKAMVARLEANQFTGVMPTIAQFAQRFLDHQKMSTAALTQKLQGQQVTLHIVPAVGKLRIDEVDVAELDRVTAVWATRGDASTTINSRLGTFRRMLQVALEWRYLVAIPKFKWLPTDHHEETVQFLTDQQAGRLLEAAAPPWRSLILVGLRTGMRIGELRGLKWTDLNFETRSIRIARTDPGRPDVAASSPKGGKSRTVPMTGDVFACLTELAKARTYAWVWPAQPRWSGDKPANRPRSGSGCYHGILRAAKLAGPDVEALVTPHVLRHTFASQLVMRGVALKVVQELLGHASIRQTEVYAHLSPGFAHHAAVAALDTPLIAAPTAPLELAAPPEEVTLHRFRLRRPDGLFYCNDGEFRDDIGEEDRSYQHRSRVFDTKQSATGKARFIGHVTVEELRR